MTVTITRIGRGFEDWDSVLALIREAFAHMDGRIDPPSSVHRLTVEKMRADAAAGAAFLALDETDSAVGCIFSRPKGDILDLGKIAVRSDWRGQGVARSLLAATEAEARDRGLAALELQSRIELTEDHAAFAALGFAPSGTTSHPGFDRPTSLTMRRPL